MFGKLFGNQPADAESTDINAPQQPEAAEESGPRTDGPPAMAELPADADAQKQSLWKQLSGLIGQDITSKISLPVWVFEPLSFTQILADPMQYSGLLAAAAAEPDRHRRMALIATFVVTGYALASRTKKPFNPVLGETFELDFDPTAAPATGVAAGDSEHEISAGVLLARAGAVSAETAGSVSEEARQEAIELAGETPAGSACAFKYFSEQVSHHPPICVSHAVAEGKYHLQLDMELKSAFRGNSSDVVVEGSNDLELTSPDGTENYSWGHAKTTAHNILVGSMWVEHHGDFTIKCKESGIEARLHLHPSSWLGSGRYRMWADVVDSEGNSVLKLHGLWNDTIYVLPSDHAEAITAAKQAQNSGWFSGLARSAKNAVSTNAGSSPVPMPPLDQLDISERGEVLWRAPKRFHVTQWRWSPFTQSLNFLPVNHLVPATDARMREDRAALLEGDNDRASAAKHRLEEEQRALRRARHAAGEEWELRFHERIEDEEYGRKYSLRSGEAGDYWKMRETLIVRPQPGAPNAVPVEAASTVAVKAGDSTD